ncbi:right-handed parallel beta-helix repeat-containing protein [Modestobacter sp. VKM Ac-2977]|uniref:right-handed parallel beta-helix repeat-containing protein n=1 Tax=Modestobacter sp. VKM Ac-2977 TaxID=3004131 RepID=UPI0022AAAEF6|nr:right-handed parallel beta-helix repeat-containing protein [Modestobacter sp. VKM Ac-2977]MCZ2822751.1 right-handed parallel beta-helix repeat-containing protein [Modestobacter sp. VKM Ac-2977]
MSIARARAGMAALGLAGMLSLSAVMTLSGSRVEPVDGSAAAASAGLATVDQVNPTADVRVAAVDGAGTSCTAQAPCDSATAISKATPGSVVALLPGSYPKQDIAATALPASVEAPVVLRPAGEGLVEIDGVNLKAPGIRLEGLRMTGTVYVHPSAVGTSLRGLHVDGAGVFLRSDDSEVLDSVIENGSGVDGLQIKEGDGILVQGNTIRFFDATVGHLHADCLQLFDVRNVTIRGNSLHDCDNASIIFSPGAGLGIENVLLEGNFVTGCRTVGELCRGGTAIDLRENAQDVTVRNNTFAGGSVRIAQLPGLVNDRNVFGYLSSCSTPMTNSIVDRWNEGLCRVPDAVGSDGNRQGSPEYVDQGAVDFHVSASARESVQISPVQVAARNVRVPAVDFDGELLTAGTAGADEPGGVPAAPDSVESPAVVPPTGAPASDDVVGEGPGADETDSEGAGSSSGQPAAPTGEPAPTTGIALVRTAEPLSGLAVFTAEATGGPVTNARFSVPGRALSLPAQSVDGGLTWTARIDTRLVADGTYPVLAVAVDAAGELVSSPQEMFEVDN